MTSATLPALLPFTLGETATVSEPKETLGAASWEWLLCDGYGNTLAELTTATGKQLTFKRNNYTEAQCVISHEDDAAYPLLTAVKNGPLPTLRCYRRAEGESAATLRFNGYLAPFTETLDDAGLLTLIFRSPFGRLVGDGGAQNGRYIGAGLTAEEKYADQIAASLIRLYGGAAATESLLFATDPTFNETKYEGIQAEYPVGLRVGTLAQTSQRFVSYKYANVGQAIIYLSQMTNGFDFDETFVTEGQTLAYFNTYSTLGELKPAAVFQYGPGTLANIRKVERTTSSPLNAIRLMGSSGVVTPDIISEMGASLAAYGLWFSQQQAIGTSVLTTLEARALGMRRAEPVKTFKLEPEILAHSCPKPWDDFFIGDTVSFYGRRGAFEDSVLARVNEIQVVIDENGYEAAAIPASPDATQPDELHMAIELETGNVN